MERVAARCKRQRYRNCLRESFQLDAGADLLTSNVKRFPMFSDLQPAV